VQPPAQALGSSKVPSKDLALLNLFLKITSSVLAVRRTRDMPKGDDTYLLLKQWNQTLDIRVHTLVKIGHSGLTFGLGELEHRSRT
jgi:hypothetical protein